MYTYTWARTPGPNEAGTQVGNTQAYIYIHTPVPASIDETQVRKV